MNQMSHITPWVSCCQRKYTNREEEGRRRQICGCTHANLDRRQDEFSLCNRKNPLDSSSHSRLRWLGQSLLHWQTPLRCHSFIYEWVFGERKKMPPCTSDPSTDSQWDGNEPLADPSSRLGAGCWLSWSALSCCNEKLSGETKRVSVVLCWCSSAPASRASF